MNKGIFITATDTGVGKTFVSGLIARYLKKKGINLTVVKPFATGCEERDNRLISNDIIFLKSFVPLDVSLDKMSIINYKLPLAPFAVELESGKVWKKQEVINNISELRKSFDFIIIEGIGGLKVPLAHKYYVSSLIQDLNYPVLIVSRPNLGTLNHTLLTIDKLENDGANIIGIVFNTAIINNKEDSSIRTNADIIEKESGYKVLGKIPYFKDLEQAKKYDELSFIEDYL